ncbi:hypothetical protein KL86APRO_12270 [uncultured Alphaproteobacteria bacterium]|uniref:Uncharacterized protein n=1 Tax=uncultured Alphaproteobacteria bacterium TaxID=91750 RepID=A0A212K828_9PROT|nr:hypothetical protein KL86APRO_12270 [uncultured Alphaproteobacteria bacterium]
MGVMFACANVKYQNKLDSDPHNKLLQLFCG